MAEDETQIDAEREREGLLLMHRAEDALLDRQPHDDEKCKDCKWYVGFDGIAYCWHQKIRMLVGPDWWCQWFETEEESEEMKAYQESAAPEAGRVG